MNRRGFLATLLAIPAALLAGLGRPSMLFEPLAPAYSIKPFLDYQRKEIARIFRIPVHLLGDDGSSTFGSWEGTADELDELRRKWIETTTGGIPGEAGRKNSPPS